MSDPAPAVYGFGEWRVDLTRRLVLRHDQPVPLPPRAFDTLLFLLQHRGRVVGKDELLQAVWPDTFVENNLNQSISALRRAFGERRGDHRFIATVAGRGYQFVAETHLAPPEATAVAPDPVVTGIAEPATSPVRTAVVRAGTANRRGMWTAVALVALSIVGGSGSRRGPGRSSRPVFRDASPSCHSRPLCPMRPTPRSSSAWRRRSSASWRRSATSRCAR